MERAGLPLTLLKLTATSGWLALVRPVRDLGRTLRRAHPVRIFTFHRVTHACRDGMTVAPSVFEEQLRFIKRHHDVVDIDTAIQLIARGTRLSRPAAAITFDDGYRSVLTNALPVTERLGVVAACFVCPGIIDGSGRFAHDAGNPSREATGVMDWSSLKQLQQAGWHIGSHTSSHARLSGLDREVLERELLEPRGALRNHLGDRPVALAYPFGAADDITPEAVNTARWCGYVALFSDHGGENVPGETDGFRYSRIDIGGGHQSLMWRAMVHGFDPRAWKRRLAA